jgi:hypothetical protein
VSSRAARLCAGGRCDRWLSPRRAVAARQVERASSVARDKCSLHATRGHNRRESISTGSKSTIFERTCVGVASSSIAMRHACGRQDRHARGTPARRAGFFSGTWRAPCSYALVLSNRVAPLPARSPGEARTSVRRRSKRRRASCGDHAISASCSRVEQARKKGGLPGARHRRDACRCDARFTGGGCTVHAAGASSQQAQTQGHCQEAEAFMGDPQNGNRAVGDGPTSASVRLCAPWDRDSVPVAVEDCSASQEITSVSLLPNRAPQSPETLAAA